MRYWAFLVAKMAAGALFLYTIWYWIKTLYRIPAYFVINHLEPFGHDLPWTILVFSFFLLFAGVIGLILWDQRYRCRECGRRLRMPVRRGSHAHLLFRPPGTEYICVYGHGTLKMPAVDLTGRQKPNWKEHQDMWVELFSVPGSNREDDPE